MARNNEPALGRKTPLLICSMRTDIPYPCIGSSARVFRTSMSKVPCITSVALSGIKVLSSYWHPSGAYACPTGCQEGKRPENVRVGWSMSLERIYVGRVPQDGMSCAQTKRKTERPSWKLEPLLVRV